MTVVTTEKTPCSADRPTAVRPRSTRCRKHAFARFSSNVSPGTQVQGYSPRSRHVSYDLHCRLAVECSVGRYYDPPCRQVPSCLPEDRVRRYHGCAVIRTNALTTCRIPQNGSGHATTSTAQKADVGIICAKSHVIFIFLWLHALWRAVLRPRH